jgi:hypothetical protein
MEASLNLEQYLELLLGPREGASSFESDESRRDAWRSHSAVLTPMVDPGSRPWAWWEYDAPEPPLPRESELDYLTRCHLLSEVERFRIERAEIQRTSRATRNP